MEQMGTCKQLISALHTCVAQHVSYEEHEDSDTGISMEIKSESLTFWIWNTTIPSLRRYSFEALQSSNTRRIGFLIAFKFKCWRIILSLGESERSSFLYRTASLRANAIFKLSVTTQDGPLQSCACDHAITLVENPRTYSRFPFSDIPY